MSGLRHVAPAGAPITMADLVRWAGSCLTRDDAEGRLRKAVAGQFGVEHSFLTSTGRAGLTLLLRAMRRLAPDERNEVAIPSYTCYSVAASVVKAGLTPRLVDVAPRSLDFAPGELERTDFTRVLAIIATNLYGLPNDLPALTRMGRQRGVFVIDDAAQAMGASVGDRWSGTWGDAGLFSFDKGKSVAAIDGGVVVTNSHDIAAAMADEMQRLSAPGVGTAGIGIVKALAYSALLRPWLYGIPAHIPQLELGTTVFTTDFPLERPSPPLVSLASTMMRRLAEYSAARRENARLLLAGLRDLPGITSPQAAAGGQPTYVRLPLLLPDKATRDAATAELNRVGIGATGSYPQALVDVPELRGRLAQTTGSICGGRFVADRILTLPTHPYLTLEDVETATGTLAALLRNAVAVSPSFAAEPQDRAVG